VAALTATYVIGVVGMFMALPPVDYKPLTGPPHADSAEGGGGDGSVDDAIRISENRSVVMKVDGKPAGHTQHPKYSTIAM
jgi:hypothetical protein